MIRSVFPGFLAVLALGACVEPSPEVGNDEQSIITYSLSTVVPAAPAPTVSAWTGVLPADIGGGNQVWLFTPASQGSYHLLQIDPVAKVVAYHTVVNANQYPTAVTLTAQRAGLQMSIRNPPPPPPPWTEDLVGRQQTAQFGVNLGRHAQYTSSVPWWK